MMQLRELEKLNEKEKATATLTYLKYKKLRDEMQKLKMHGGPDDYLENLEKIKKEEEKAREELQKESEKLVKEIYYFDVLRSDRSISSNGLEARTPFLDKAFVKYYLSIPPELKIFDGNDIFFLRSENFSYQIN